jgi:tRNA-Thr(GGU) m(6)t(6)A37 methyltransferase TsaA
MPELLTLQPIGVIRTPFKEKYAAPRQPGTENIIAPGKVILDRGMNFEQALDDLEGFDKIWLIYWFDRNSNWKPKVLPPRGSAIKRGVFSTRSPHRPNPIGLSLVALVKRQGRNLFFEGADMLDKTPLLDIKPYLPAVESYPDARTGWLPIDIQQEQTHHRIYYSSEAEEYLNNASASLSRELRQHIEHSLRYDIAPHPYKRIEQIAEGRYLLAYKQWRIEFDLAPNELLIRTIRQV